MNYKEFSLSITKYLVDQNDKNKEINSDIFFGELFSRSLIFDKDGLLTITTFNILRLSWILFLKVFYLLKLKKMESENEFNDKRKIYIVVLILSQKILIDHPHRNILWVNITGLKLKEINDIDRKILSILDYNLFIHEKTFKENIIILIKLLENIQQQQQKNSN